MPAEKAIQSGWYHNSDTLKYESDTIKVTFKVNLLYLILSL